MLHRYINQFVEYCQLADFSVRSIQALDIRLNEFEAFLKSLRILSVKKITYLRLRKSRVWTLRQFYHFLTLHRHVPKNIALKLPYPKIEKTVPQFLKMGSSLRLTLA
jgi:integrase/recombinase XerC